MPPIPLLADVSINTVYKLLIDAGEVCLAYQDQAFRNLPCKRLQLDEIWSFIYTKQRKVLLAKTAPGTTGDVWTWGCDLRRYEACSILARR